ncbi:MAG: peptidylprolyl isomerase [Chloroflexi bacterium]|nr:peptidylprolyl isomerase [Chloroflexota bacterium]
MTDIALKYRAYIATLFLGILVAACAKGATPTSVAPTSPSYTPIPTPVTPATPVPGQTDTLVPYTPAVPSAQPTNTSAQIIAAAAIVNGQPIPLQEYEAQVTMALNALSQQSSEPQTEEEKAALLTQLRRQILDALIDQVLIEQAAAREGIAISEEQVEAEMARLIGDDTAKFEEWLQANGMTRDSFKAQLKQQLLSATFQEHVINAQSPIVEQVHARHILLLSEEEAMEVFLKLRAGESFTALAKQYSQDRSTKDNGGDLGFFPRGVMPPEIEAVAFGLNPGQTSGIVKTSFGYHIIEVVEKDPARKVSDEMLPTWQQKQFLQWLAEQRALAKIQYLIPLE